jgi:hypothetical protein
MPPRRPPARSTFDRHRRWACRANGTAGEERRATYRLITGRSFTQVLFSGQDALPELVEHAADYSLGVLILLVL